MVHVHVTTRPVDSDAPGKHVVIDHDVPEHRHWLGKHCFWAFRNGHVITTYPTDEAVTYRPKAPKPEPEMSRLASSSDFDHPCPDDPDGVHFAGCGCDL
ncbi:hypothetical protein [Shinella zoogloeoides]|uniref:hypothetical protein n=1 Tax=Shinella zoogloeoides TaxID=352475 RepID=UPI00299E2297|nr:hypothetical protein [Shinella zoogloeoides]WPE19913.1 hypothetical protein ShzoTeo12_10890 [Shinella zoogloeoides]